MRRCSNWKNKYFKIDLRYICVTNGFKNRRVTQFIPA